MAHQVIEPPSETDIDAIARSWLHANSVCRDVIGIELDGSSADLPRLQRLISSGSIDRSATYTLQSLGIAFGKVFVNENPGYDWWMVQDEYGRDPAIRFAHSSLLAYPRTMISKRVEDGKEVDIADLYDGLCRRLAQLVEEGYGAT